MKSVIVIHGGAGALTRQAMTPEKELRYLAALSKIICQGQRLLKSGASALDVVTEAVTMLEDCPLFNAGRGAVFTHQGTHELDASIMDGRTLEAGSVVGVQRICHPIQAARKVMERSVHIMFTAAGAEALAREQGLEMVEPDYFSTDERYQQLLAAQQGAGTVVLDHDAPLDPERKFGTVGAVALDAEGNLAAATSTGGMTNKQVGRVGDSPIIGAGCYASNRTAAVSCTGTGETFMRTLAAYDVAAMMEYGGLSVSDAASRVVMDKITSLGGSGGLIAIDGQGNIALPFNSEGMYRGYGYVDDEPVVAIYRDRPA